MADISVWVEAEAWAVGVDGVDTGISEKVRMRLREPDCRIEAEEVRVW